jgi:FkbM family methyltransferase
VYPTFFILLSVFQFIHIPVEALNLESAIERLQAAHSRLRLIHGSFEDEYPEQLMTAMYLPANAKVLELGANVGRNSCVIASLLNDSKNLVSVESIEEFAKLLQENRDVNGLQFHIEVGAISKIPLIQSWWTTMPSDEDKPGWARVKTITYSELKAKYGIKFDTLVVDCEGALYYILRDEPNILKKIKLIIIENDFSELNQMLFVQNLFKQNGLQCVYSQAGGWGPCSDQFYQVWKK